MKEEDISKDEEPLKSIPIWCGDIDSDFYTTIITKEKRNDVIDAINTVRADMDNDWSVDEVIKGVNELLDVEEVEVCDGIIL